MKCHYSESPWCTHSCLTSAKFSKYGHTSNLEIHFLRIPFSDLKGTRKICVCSVPLTLSSLWLHVVPFASGINLVTLKNECKICYMGKSNIDQNGNIWRNGPNKSINILTIRILGLKSRPCFCILRSISFSKARTWSSM